MVRTENASVGDHAVRFYGHEDELAERVAGYLLEGLRDGDAAVVIATGAHRRQFEDRLRQAGVDLAAARENGSYLAVDAGQAVGELMAADRLDQACFDRVIGGLIKQATTGGRPVRAYGEMVAVLWGAGLVNDAVQLETMWNGLAEVCRLHPEVAGLSPATATWPGVPGAVRRFGLEREAPAAARHFVVGALRSWDAEDLADDAALVVTELAANAIVHAHSAFTVILSARDDVVRISVLDGCPLPPAAATGSGSGGAGASPALPPAPLHGLGAIDALASRWGVDPFGSAGKAVWVELRR